MLHRLLRGRVVPGLLAVPLVAGVAVPSAFGLLRDPAEVPTLGMISDVLGPGDGLGRFVVTVERDLPPQQPGGAHGSTWTGPATYDENIAHLAGAAGVEAVVPLGGNRALVAVEEGTSARVLPFVRSAEPAATVTPHAVPAPDDELFGQHWALRNTGAVPGLQSAQVAGADVDALSAWQHARGEGVVVAVIDNGYDYTHPDMAAALWTNPDEGCDPAVDRDGNGYKGDCHGWNYYRAGNDVSNIVDGRHLSTHGTPVASTIAAEANNGYGGAGLAPQTKIMPLVIGGGSDLYTSYVAPSIRYAADNGADIINMSFGIGGNVPEVESAVRYAASKGVLMVASAGNSGGLNRDVSPVWPVSYVLPEMMGAGSSTPSDGVAAHSDHGPTTVHVHAPGQEVLVARPGSTHGLAHGTSFAAPITAGAAALVMAARPDMTAVEVKQLLVQTAEPLGAMAGRSVSGGRLDAGRALATLTAPAQVSITGLDGVTAKTAGTATVRVEGTGEGLPAGDLSLQVSLGAYKDGYVYAIADLPLDAGAAGAGATGQDGSLVLSPSGLTAAALVDGVDVPLTMTLPQGRYGLVAQLLSDGQPVTPPQAAAFTVGTPVDSGDDLGGGSGGGTPGAPQPGAPQPGAPAPGPVAPAPGTPAPGTPAPGTPAPGAPGPRTPAPAAPAPGAPAPAPGTPAPGAPAPAPGTPAPAAPAPGAPTPAPGTPAPGTPKPGAPAPGTPKPGTPAPAPAPGAPAPGTPAPAPDPGTPAPAPGTPGTGGAPGSTACSTVRFGGSGTFGTTALTPSCGGLAGGTIVTITGTRLPAGAAVRVGTSGATVLPGSTATTLTIATPPRGSSGPVDVVVYARDRTVHEVLPGAFTYQAAPPAPGDGGTGGGSGGGAGGDTGGGSGGDTGDGSGGGAGGGSGGGTGGGTGGGSGGGSTGPGSDPADFEGLTLVDTGGSVGGLTAAGMALLTDCGASCFATKLG